MAVVPATAGGLAVVATELRDNGDHDGYADTNETVELWLTLRNTTGSTVTGAVAQISSGPVTFYYESQPRLRMRWTAQPGATLYDYAVQIHDHLTGGAWCLWGSTEDAEIYADAEVGSGLVMS